MVLDRLPENFLLMNGDILDRLDYGDLLDSHVSSGAPLTVATFKRVHQVDFGCSTSSYSRVTNFTEKSLRSPIR